MRSCIRRSVCRFAAKKLSVLRGSGLGVGVAVLWGMARERVRGGAGRCAGGVAVGRELRTMCGCSPGTVMADRILGIRGTRSAAHSDTWIHVVSAGQLSPPRRRRTTIRGGNKQLPSVSTGGSLSDGLFFSRSANGGCLSGTAGTGPWVYNRSHLVGLLDAFNHDVFRTGALCVTRGG